MTFCSQAELATRSDENTPAVPQNTSDTHTIVFDPYGVSDAGVPQNSRDADAVVSGVDHGSAHPHPDNHLVASKVHPRTSKSQEDGADRDRAVSIALTCLSPSNDSPPLSLMPGKCPRVVVNPMHNNLHQAHPGSPLLHHLRRCLQFTRKFNMPSPRFSAKSMKYNRR